MSCCGRPNNRNQKSGASSYYARYAYLNSHQKAQQEKVAGSKCDACDALTVGDPCSVCGGAKTSNEEEQV